MLVHRCIEPVSAEQDTDSVCVNATVQKFVPRRLPALVDGCCLAVVLMLHVSHPRPGPVPRQAGSEVGRQRLSTRSQAAPDRRSFLTMVAHAPVAAMAGEGSATAGRSETAGNGAAPAQLDGVRADEYPTIEHQVRSPISQPAAGALL